MPVCGTELALRRFEFGVANGEVCGSAMCLGVGALGPLQQHAATLVQRRVLQGHSRLAGKDTEHCRVRRVEHPPLRCPRGERTDHAAVEGDGHERVVRFDLRLTPPADPGQPNRFEAVDHVIGQRWTHHVADQERRGVGTENQPARTGVGKGAVREREHHPLRRQVRPRGFGHRADERFGSVDGAHQRA